MKRSQHGLMVIAGLCLTASPAAADPPKLSLPIACEVGKTCFVQKYVDVEPGPEVKDHACGTATDDGHTGTDIRLRSAAEVKRNVAVLAAADGTVVAVRDEMPDSLIRPGQDTSAIMTRGCGNVVTIDHGDGWLGAYCHMRRGSITVKPGEAVKRGQAIGSVGYSGLAGFAHLHFEVRHNGKVVDPFSTHEVDGTCNVDPEGKTTLWDDAAEKALGYVNGQIIGADFSGAVPVLDALEDDDAPAPLDKASQQLVFYARLTNLRAGDRVKLAVTGPDGFAVESTSDPVDRNKATYTLFTGKKRTTPAWAAGVYEGKASIIRRDAEVASARSSFEMK